MNVYEAIQKDLKTNMTPDLATLRYFGQDFLPVFLWDGLQDYTVMSSAIQDFKALDYKFVNVNALTVEDYLPWYNIKDSSTPSFDAYCLSDYQDLEYVNVEDYMIDEPKKLSGKVVGLKLRALQGLDRYYQNELSFERQLVCVTPSTGSGKAIEVYAYFNELEDISIYSQATSEWVLSPRLDFTPFHTNKEGNFEM